MASVAKISKNAVEMSRIKTDSLKFRAESEKRMKSVDILRKPQKIQIPPPSKRPKLTCEDFVLDPHPEGSELKMCNLFRHPNFNHRDFLVLHVHVDLPGQELFECLSNGLLVSYRNKKTSPSRYMFFGHSSSQLRNRTCYMYNEKLGNLNDIINLFGDFSSINNVAKRAARIGLLLSTANEVLRLKDAEISKEGDIERDGYNFTDGCGTISIECAMRVAESKGLTELYKNQYPPVPSVFQIRLKGCKGVLVVDPKLQKGIKLRDSLEKFSWKLVEPHILGVVDDGIAKPYAYGNLIKHFIRILSALGIPDKAFLKLQTTFFDELQNLEKDKWIAVKHLYINGRSDLAEKVIATEGGDYCSSREIREVLKSIRRKVFDDRKIGASDKLERIKKSKAEGLNIRAEMSRNVFGVCDISETLEEGTVFFQPTIRGKSQVIKGRVFVAKSPSYYPGDIRILNCVDNKHIRHLVDCVVFPVKGSRPHCDEIAGSDLDGDKYLICWDPTLVPKTHWQPTSYQGCKAKTQANITTTHLIDYFARYDVRLVARFSNLLEKWADMGGIDSPECMALANLFNHAIDSAKTGENVTIPKCLLKVGRPKENAFICQKMVSNAKLLSGETKDSISKIEKEMMEEYGENSEEYKTFKEAASLVYKAGDEVRTEHCYEGDSNILQRQRSGIIQLLMIRYNLEICEKSTILSHDLMNEDEKTISSLLRSNNWPADNFKLFRMMFKWCCRNDKMDLLSEFCQLIDFKTFTRLQRDLAMVDCPDSTDVIKAKHSGLNHSSILSQEDIATLDSEISPTKWSLMYTMADHTQESFSWEEIISKVAEDLPKLLICKFDLGGIWIITILIPGALELSQMSNDATTSPGLRAFVSIHGFKSENCIVDKGQFIQAVLVRRSRLQIYPADQSTGNTFINIMEENGHTVMSVALQNFSTGFKSRHRNAYLRREPVMSCELFLGYTDIRMLPTYYIADTDPPDVEPVLNDSEVPEFEYNEDDFPVVSHSQHTEHKKTWFDEVDKKFDELKVFADNETLLDSQLQEFFAMAEGDSENGAYIASYTEILFSKTNAKLSNDYTDDPYYKLLCFLAMERNFAVPKTSRFLESMERKCTFFRVATYVNFLKLLIYGNAVETHSVDLLKQFEIGLFPLDPTDFKTEGAKTYFLRWTSLLTIEVLEEAKVFKKTAINTDNFSKAHAFPESKLARWLNIQAPRQTFLPQDGMALTPSHQMDENLLFQPKYFAECVQSKRTGLMIQVNLICKVGSSPDELTAQDVPRNSYWRVDRFASLVSYRRMIDALKNICALSSDTVKETCPIASEISPEFHHSDVNADNAKQPEHEREVPDNSNTLEQSAVSGAASSTRRKPAKRGEARVLNESQMEAVDAAMNDGITIIQGPPGTGKTFTATEIIKRWVDTWDSKPILACAETNEGVNNLIMKVLTLGFISPDDMVRIGNVSKVTDDMKRITLEAKYSAGGHKMHAMQMDFAVAKDIIHRAKIVFTTCIGAGVGYMTDQHFPHVLMDEASQATEPAAIVPLQYGCIRLCLVGDDKQLPPLVKSSNADNLKMSIFER
ncbi:uncharacterized protein [Antedon mediterranea]|uniref:uncharacterized protein n=1 Tax=Antedon mediterranea TaxID=105859 RepID=UPI003AF5F85B